MDPHAHGYDRRVSRTMPPAWAHKQRRELIRRRARRRLAGFYVVLGVIVSALTVFTVTAAR
jgi:hypothetical protein